MTRHVDKISTLTVFHQRKKELKGFSIILNNNKWKKGATFFNFVASSSVINPIFTQFNTIFSQRHYKYKLFNVKRQHLIGSTHRFNHASTLFGHRLLSPSDWPQAVCVQCPSKVHPNLLIGCWISSSAAWRHN